MTNKVGKLLIKWDESNSVWEITESEINQLLNKKNPKGYWRVRGENIGWRNLSGERVMEVSKASHLFSFLSNDCIFNVFNYNRGLAIQVFHHDSPVGNEWYYLLPIAQSTYEKEKR